MNSLLLAISALTALAIALMSLLLLRKKHRLIWQKLWRLQEELQATASEINNEFENAFKQLAMQRFSGNPRLKLKLPSQHGEDVLLWNFFGRKTDGQYVEVGAFDGVTFSNSYFFEAIGWTGILVEAVPAFCERARRTRPFSRVVNKAVAKRGTTHVTMQVAEGGQDYVGAFSFVAAGADGPPADRIRSRGARVRAEVVESATLDEILGDTAGPIDFISIDVEGRELDVLEYFSFERHAPQVFVIEDNSNGQDRRVPELLAHSGYVERLRRGPNVFYTKKCDEREFTWV